MSGFVFDADFWNTEKDAPILLHNKKYLQQQQQDAYQSLRARVESWCARTSLTSIKLQSEQKLFLAFVQRFKSKKTIPDRIFVKDSERTYVVKRRQELLVHVLTYLVDRFGDYHQGLGLAAGFLLLITPPETAVAMLTRFHEDDRYFPGVWRAEAINMATDSYVLLELMQQHMPQVSASLLKHYIAPEMFCVKYWCGLCIHVLPFEALFLFWDQWVQDGFRFLFRFTLSLLTQFQSELLKAEGTGAVLEVLRLAKKDIPAKRIMDVLSAAKVDRFSINDLDFTSLRKRAFDTHLKKRLQNANDAHADQVSTTTPEVCMCARCEGKPAEYYCVECATDLCEDCMDNDPPPGHDDEHQCPSQEDKAFLQQEVAFENLKIE